MHKFALIRWLEDPPKWDVISSDLIEAVHWEVAVGDTVPVKYGAGTCPASILNFGKYRHIA